MFRQAAVLFLLLMSVVTYSQVENRNLFPTPNAASLGMYGQFPVDYFTGLPQIDIPVYEYKSGSLSIPVHLSYHPGGIKPADHASWVGLGWTLQAGGAITRIINDLPDEWVNVGQAYGEASSYPDNSSAINANKFGFFYNYSILGDTNWASSTLNTEYQLLFPATPAISSSQGNALAHRKDKAPDEFTFNFMGMSGSFFMGQDGLWKMKSKQGLNFKVSYVTGPYLVEDPKCTFTGSIIYYCLTKFILTGNDGTQYYFGADSISNIHATNYRLGVTSGSFLQDWGYGKNNFLTGDSTAIEFTRINPGGGDALKGRDGGTIPISWYLTKIKTVTGDSVTFKYTRDGYQIINNPAGSFYHYNNCPNCYQPSGGGGSVTGSDDQLSILDGVSLSSINGFNGSVNFNKSKANILDFTLVGWSLPQSTLDLFCAYGYELFNGTMPTCASSEVAAKRSTFVKLDSINVINNSKSLESFYFNYTENTNNRLFLDSMTFKSSDNNPVTVTRFANNNKAGLAGVPYETVDVDHWGYYNGVNPLCSYFSSPSTCSGTFNSQNLLNPAITNYYNSRTPNPDSMQVGILTSITYPTGGNTQFVWEPNTYSKTLTQNATGKTFTITPTDQNKINTGPGVRIKQINSTAGFNAPVLTKNFLYYRDYFHHSSYLSSGVLNGAPPKYIDIYTQAGQFTDTVWTSYNRTPMHLTNGSLLTYSDVIEQNSDGSMKEYIFSNHDNGYADRVPVASEYYEYSSFNFEDFRNSSTDLERGFLLQENTYAQGSTLLVRKSYQYNNNVNRYAGAIRRYLNVNKFALQGTLYSPLRGFFPGNPIYQGADLYALEIYTHFPYLQSDTTVQYDQNGLNPLITINNYTYDNYRNKKTTTTYNSKEDTLVTTMNYCTDSISGLSANAQSGKNIMLNRGMTAIPLESILTRNSNRAKYNRIDYGAFPSQLNPFVVPTNSYEANGSGTTELKTQYVNYNNRGNIAEYIQRNGIPVSFDWGYNEEYPVVHIINAANTLHDSVYIYYTTLSSGSTFSIGGGSPSAFNYVVTFTQTQVGAITISGSNAPPGALVSSNFTLSGPSNQSGSLCSGSNCGSTPSSVTFNNMPAGVYTLNLNGSTSFQSYSFSYSIHYSYIGAAIGTATPGIKEFFYEGFEESSLSGILSDLPHTGKYYLNANYTTSYSPPNTRNYVIQWWNFANGKWNLNQQTYSNGMVLAGPVDDIRIFPSDAQINTYTYEPLKGISSMWDVNNKTTYYQYDAANRLAAVLDQDKNVIKRFCYNYAGEPVDCSLPAYSNVAKSGNFSKNNCPSGYFTNPVTYTVLPGTYSSTISQADADLKAQNDVNANGQAYANANGTCFQTYYNVQMSGTFTRNNCPTGYAGTTVTYTVAANTYSSTISQADANNQAQNDINTNGQAFANTNGSCNPVIAISGNTFLSCSSNTTGSGVISAPPGYVTRVNISAGGAQGSYTFYITISGGVNLSKSVSNGSTSFTFTMPASGSVNWSGNISCSDNRGSGSVSVQ